MMSSEEDITVDSFGVLKKTKRARQRVDAGEPRNSYSSIPNFSSRPTILNSNIYGAFFAAPNHQQQQQHFPTSNGLATNASGGSMIGSVNNSTGSGSNPNSVGGLYFGQVGFGSTKMLELLRSRVKNSSISNDNGDAMISLDVAAAANEAVTAISGAAYECLNNQSAINCGTGSPLNGGIPMSGSSPPVADMAQHMLRNILQGVGRSKKDLYALERELREVGNINNNNNNNSNHNNNNETELSIDCINDNVLNNSNGNHINSDRIMDEDENDEIEDEDDDELDHNNCNSMKPDPDNIDKTPCIESSDLANNTAKNLTNGNVEDTDAATDTDDKDKLEASPHPTDKLNDCSASERSISSPDSVSNNNNNNNIKEDPDETIKECIPSHKSEQKELKRARVENIVSGMRSSPLPVPVNGCKKRKLYHPQQHDNSVAERYANLDVVDTLSEDEDETLCSAEIRKKVVEKNALKNQLRTVQEQLAEMQQKYVQLCTQIEEDPIDMDETTSDIDQDDDIQSITSPAEKERVPTPIVSANCKENYSSNNVVSQTSVSPAIPKILSSKFLPQNTIPGNVTHLNPHTFPLHPNFNGAALSFLQHQIFQEQQHAAAAAAAAAQNHLQSHHHPHHHNPVHSHPAFNNAAAMYLGVSQKLLLEQEARLAKEAALAAAAAEHHHQQQQTQSIQEAQSSHTPQSNSPALHNQQPPTQHPSHSSGTTTKETCLPRHMKNEPSPATPANASSSLSSVSSTSSSSSLSSLSQQQQQQQQTSILPSTKSNADTTTTATPTATVVKSNSIFSQNALDLDGLADSLKIEITTTLSTLIDTIMSRFLQQKRALNKISDTDQANKDLLLGSHLLDHKSPRTKVIDRGNCGSIPTEKNLSNNTSHSSPSKGHSLSNSTNSTQNFNNISATVAANPENNINALNVAAAARSGFGSTLFTPPKIGSSGLNSAAAAAALYSSMANGLGGSHLGSFCMTEMRSETAAPEQNEALSLVVPQKKKRHKVTDTRITPRTVSRILAQDGIGCPPPPSLLDAAKYSLTASNGGTGISDSPPPPPPPPRPFHHIPHSAPMLPVSLPTSVAIPNPSLHESQVFSSYSPFYGAQHQPPHHLPSSSPPNMSDHIRDSPPLSHHTSMFHPALLAAAQQQQQQQQHREQQQQQQREHQQQQREIAHHQRGTSSPDFMNLLPGSGPGGESLGPGSECNSMDFDGLPPTSSTLSPMHLRKAKLMFFWVRYPTSAVLKMYFPDIRFNKNNTAQLVKWFSNFREFYYIQMEKYARAAIADGIKNADDIHVSIDSDIYRVLNLHYNRNNHIEVPSNFRYVVEQTLKEFFKAVQIGKDQDQSWKKPIYKVIGRLDDPVPEYFKSPNFLEQLE